MVAVEAERLGVHFAKRCHNPILGEAAWDAACPPIPRLGPKTLAFAFP